MPLREIILGTPPTGVGGDTPRAASIKINAMMQEIYRDLPSTDTPVPVSRGGTGSKDAPTARSALGLVPVTSPLDFTAGRLLTVGYGGRNGGLAQLMPAATSLNTLLDSVLYALNSAYTDGPSWFNGQAIFVENAVHGKGASGYLVQECWSIVNPMLRAVRALVAGVFTAWDTQLPITGSNANGTYVMLPGGVLESFVYATSTQTFPATNRYNATWTFPMAFVGAPPVVHASGAGRLGGVIQSCSFQVYGPTLTGAVCAIQQTGGGNLDDVRDLAFRAIGRWKL